MAFSDFETIPRLTIEKDIRIQKNFLQQEIEVATGGMGGLWQTRSTETVKLVVAVASEWSKNGERDFFFSTVGLCTVVFDMTNSELRVRHQAQCSDVWVSRG